MNAILRTSYPWIQTPIIAGAPMLRISLAPLAAAISKAGGIGFLAGGFDLADLDKNLQEARDLVHRTSPPIPHEDGVFPIGIGFLTWGAKLDLALAVIKEYVPAAAWLYAPYKLADLAPWAEQIRKVSGGKTKIWVQIGTVAEAMEIAKVCRPDVIVVQGSDSGGHGLKHSASIITLLPEVRDVLAAGGFKDIVLIAAGGIVDGRGMAAVLTLGADGIVMGTRFLASKEAQISGGYQTDILKASDGGTATVRTKIYDIVRGIPNWPKQYDGRGLINLTYLDDRKGISHEENKKMYDEAIELGDDGWGPRGRMTTYAGTGVGLVNAVLPAGDIVRGVALESKKALEEANGKSRL